MNDDLEQRARAARAAVHARTGRLDADKGLDHVVRRARRPRASTVLAVLLLAVLAVPALAWLLRPDVVDVRFGDDPPPPADGQEVTPTPDDEKGEPSPGDEPGPGPGEPSATPTGGTPTPTEAQPVTPMGTFGTEDVESEDFPMGGGEVALLTDVRLGGHEGFDRIVLEFRGEDVPSYRVAYQQPPVIQDGSGQEIEVEGAAFLELRLTPASGVDLSGADYEVVYEGPDRVRGNTGVVTEVVRTGDFEANLAWVAGLEGRAPFSVTVLHDPLRLVVDVRHP